MVIGATDPKYGEDDIYGHRVTGSLGWSLQMIGVSVGDTKDYSIEKFMPAVNRACTDTGTFLLGLPIRDYNTVIKHFCEYLDKKFIEPQSETSRRRLSEPS